MTRYKYKISNLDCANCAKKLEDGLNKENILKNVIVNFSSSKISFDADREYSIDEINKMIVVKDKLSYAITKEKNEEKRESMQISIDKINSKSKLLRKKVKICESIELRHISMETNLKEFEKKEEVERNEPIRLCCRANCKNVFRGSTSSCKGIW